MRPLIAITMGDPASIGSELCIKLLSKKEVYEKCKPLIIGDVNCIRDAIGFTHSSLKVNILKSASEGKYEFGEIDILDLENVDMSKLEYGKVSAMCGKASGEYIAKAIDFAMKGEVDATVTNPINKEAFKLGGWGEKYSGHTEMYADLTKTKNYTMMIAHGNFRTVHVSVHVSLRKACDLVKKDRVVNVIKIANDACKDMGIDDPKIGVASLNPHAGDGGLFGTEEIDEIIPAVEEAKSLGYNVEGPVPADTIYSKAKGGWYDIVVSMYHDQGHIPLKLSGFIWDGSKKEWTSISGVNVTLGLPIIRVAVDHGTAFGKAGKGLANVDSLCDATMLAVRFAETKIKKKQTKD
jgi:4-hydroxythreonine-4-phosphate dehydrogenase